MPRSDRLFALGSLLAGPKRRRLAELATRLEASQRTIYRDLEDLEDRGFPIERVDGTYRFMDGTFSHPLPLTPRERFLLALALDNPSIRRQPSLARDLKKLRLKLAGQLDDEPPVAKLGGPDRSGAITPEVHEELETAIRDHHSLSILYTSLTTGKPEWRGIDPWALVHRAEAWYLVGRCHVHNEPRTFRLDRIEGVFPIGQSFEPPPEFDLERWLDSRWGIFEGDSQDESIIIFDRSLAPLIRHGQHHPTELKRKLADGSIEYRVRVGNLDELARWVVGFSGKARAVEPPRLVEAVQSIVDGAAAAHPRKRAAAAMVRRKR